MLKLYVYLTTYASLRRAGTGTSAMVSNLIIAISVITAATVVGLLLGRTLSENDQIAVNAVGNTFNS